MASADEEACGSGQSRSAKPLSCLPCQQRKVRCDRQQPCGACVRAELTCTAATAVPPQRRKRRSSDQHLLMARLQRYERLLKLHRVPIEPEPAIEGAPRDGQHAPETARVSAGSGSPTKEGGRLISERNMSRYVENNLWTELSDQLREPKELLRPSTEDKEPRAAALPNPSDLVLGRAVAREDLHDLRPQSMDVFRLWQVFLDNVNPLTKLLHVPTVQRVILDASPPRTPLPSWAEALTFAIYASAVTSMSQCECQELFGQSRRSLLARYLSGLQQALTDADFLTSADLRVLQAFVLYLVRLSHLPTMALTLL